MNDNEKELNRKLMQTIPDGASREEMLRILKEKQEAAIETQARWEAGDRKFSTLVRWLDRVNYVWLAILLVAFAVGLVGKLEEGGPAALNLWSGPFRTLGLFLLFAAFAMRGKLKRK